MRELLALKRVAELAKEFGADHIAADANQLAERAAEGRFFLAVVGQFKRGKSTLINALIGAPVLPTGIVPVTNVPTVIRYGDSSARVRLADGTWNDISSAVLQDYVSEERNPGNSKNVGGVEVFCPSPLLKSGMCLVDTPGVGSVFASNTAATRELIPHIDAAIVVIGSDPPLAADELSIVEQVSAHVSDLIFVLNKADRAGDSERAVAKTFARRLIGEKLARAVEILEISAVECLAHGPATRDWPQFVAELQQLGNRSSALAEKALRRGLAQARSRLQVIVTEERRALIEPVDASRRRIHELGELSHETSGSLQDLSHLLAAEQGRLSQALEQRRQQFFVKTCSAAERELSAELRNVDRGFGPTYRRAAAVRAQQIAERYVVPWLKTEEQGAALAYERIQQRFTQMANDYLARLTQFRADEAAALAGSFEPSSEFSGSSHFQFQQFRRVAAPASPLRYVADVFLGIFNMHHRIEADMQEFLRRLLETNSSRVQSDVEERVLESRKLLEAALRQTLRRAGEIAAHALEHARQAQNAGKQAVETALERLLRIENELAEASPIP